MARWLLAETTPMWRNWGCRGKPHDKKKRNDMYKSKKNAVAEQCGTGY